MNTLRKSQKTSHYLTYKSFYCWTLIKYSEKLSQFNMLKENVPFPKVTCKRVVESYGKKKIKKTGNNDNNDNKCSDAAPCMALVAWILSGMLISTCFVSLSLYINFNQQ